MQKEIMDFEHPR